MVFGLQTMRDIAIAVYRSPHQGFFKVDSERRGKQELPARPQTPANLREGGIHVCNVLQDIEAQDEVKTFARPSECAKIFVANSARRGPKWPAFGNELAAGDSGKSSFEPAISRSQLFRNVDRLRRLGPEFLDE